MTSSLPQRGPEPRRCYASVFRGYGFSTSQSRCKNAGKVECNGKWYCLTHDPERSKARTEARSLRWAKERAVSSANYRLTLALAAAGEALASYGGELSPALTHARAEILKARANLRSAEGDLKSSGAVTPDTREKDQ